MLRFLYIFFLSVRQCGLSCVGTNLEQMTFIPTAGHYTLHTFKIDANQNVCLHQSTALHQIIELTYTKTKEEGHHFEMNILNVNVLIIVLNVLQRPGGMGLPQSIQISQTFLIRKYRCKSQFNTGQSICECRICFDLVKFQMNK